MRLRVYVCGCLNERMSCECVPVWFCERVWLNHGKEHKVIFIFLPASLTSDSNSLRLFYAKATEG